MNENHNSIGVWFIYKTNVLNMHKIVRKTEQFVHIKIVLIVH